MAELRPSYSRFTPLSLAAFTVLSCASPVDVPVQCVTPAPLLGERDAGAPGYIVVYRPGTDPVSETNRLATRYGFTPMFVYQHALQGFGADLSASALAGVRCEPSVDHVSFNASVRPL